MKNIKLFLILIGVTIVLVSCNKINSSDQVIIERIEYIYSQKSQIEKSIWPDFSNQKFDVPLIYFSDSHCYVTNPTDQFLDQFNPALFYKNGAVTIYKTALLDSIPFHMETEITFGDSSSDYNYQAPYMNCSSPELTRKIVTDVHSTELWSTMVMHEYFHGFQFKHLEFRNFYQENVNISADTLKALYLANSWFSDSVNQENRLLLSALDSDNPKEIQNLLHQFFELRDQRRAATKAELNSDISTIEAAYETMEGTARYIEFRLYSKFATEQPDPNLLQSDSLFKAYKIFNNYTLTNDKWFYQAGKTYYYATGFNMVRLLDKMGVDYKSRLFNTTTPLDEILREQINPVAINSYNLKPHENSTTNNRKSTKAQRKT